MSSGVLLLGHPKDESGLLQHVGLLPSAYPGAFDTAAIYESFGVTVAVEAESLTSCTSGAAGIAARKIFFDSDEAQVSGVYAAPMKAGRTAVTGHWVMADMVDGHADRIDTGCGCECDSMYEPGFPFEPYVTVSGETTDMAYPVDAEVRLVGEVFPPPIGTDEFDTGLDWEISARQHGESLPHNQAIVRR